MTSTCRWASSGCAPSGPPGGHNGLKNIIQHLGSERFPRIKVGVGSPKQAGYEVVDWVIGMPMGEEQKVLLETLDRAAQAIPVVITQGMDQAMNRFLAWRKFLWNFLPKSFTGCGGIIPA